MLDSGKIFLIPLGIVNSFIQHVCFCEGLKRSDIRVKTIGDKDFVKLKTIRGRDLVRSRDDASGFDFSLYEL